MSTWWATEKAKEAIQTGWGLDLVLLKSDRIVLDETETNLCVDFCGNITDGPWGPKIGTIDTKFGVLRNGVGKQTGVVPVA